MATSISNLHPWLNTPHELISQIKKPTLTIDISLFCNNTQKKLEEHKVSMFFFTVTKESFYFLCSKITTIAFVTLGIAACSVTLFWFPPYFFTLFTLCAISCYKFLPLFTGVFDEKISEATYLKSSLQSILEKEKKLLSLPEQTMNDQLTLLGISYTDFTQALSTNLSLKTHPHAKEISHALLVHLLARYEYLSERIAASSNQLKKWQTKLLEIQEALRADDLQPHKNRQLLPEARLHLQETAEKLFAIIDEFYEFDIPSEKQSSLLGDLLRAAYLLHIMKNPLQSTTPINCGKILAKQPFERASLGTIPSSYAFFLTHTHRYISKEFLIENLQDVGHIERHIFSD